jgi:dihydroorotate dehydrogenase (fumarate)
MLEKVLNTNGISAVEINLACPNIPGKPIIAYDFDQMDAVLKAVNSHPLLAAGSPIKIGVKLAPYFDLPHFKRVASIIAQYPVIKFVVTMNTIGNALFVDVENECEGIAAKQGLGGLGGGFVKHTALANVRSLFTALKEVDREDIDIVGVGGVSSGKDAFELILCVNKFFFFLSFFLSLLLLVMCFYVYDNRERKLSKWELVTGLKDRVALRGSQMSWSK